MKGFNRIKSKKGRGMEKFHAPKKRYGEKVYVHSGGVSRRFVRESVPV